jgi:hypothetical protein
VLDRRDLCPATLVRIIRARRGLRWLAITAGLIDPWVLAAGDQWTPPTNHPVAIVHCERSHIGGVI